MAEKELFAPEQRIPFSDAFIRAVITGSALEKFKGENIARRHFHFY